jgi:hypothetical protein
LVTVLSIVIARKDGEIVLRGIKFFSGCTIAS